MGETEDYDKSATPTAHKTSHQDAGSDEISVTGLSGLLGDAQTPLAHKTSHQDGGSDEISVTGLSGTLADDQHIIDSEAVSAMGTKANSNPLNHDRYADSEALAAAVQSGAITDGVTKAPTHDAVYDVKVMTEDHSARHEDGGLDEISIAALSGVAADDQHIIDSEAVSAMGTKANSNPLNHDRYTDSEALAVQHAKIQDTDTDTSLNVEESADADTIVGKVATIEALRISSEGILSLAKQPFVYVYLPSDQDIPHATATKVQFSQEVTDIQGEYDPVTNYRYTAKKAGMYQAIFASQMSNTCTDQTGLYNYLYKNGALLVSCATWASGTSAITIIPAIIQLAANDYIEFYVYQNTGYTRAIRGLQGSTWAIIYKLG